MKKYQSAIAVFVGLFVLGDSVQTLSWSEDAKSSGEIVDAKVIRETKCGPGKGDECHYVVQYPCRLELCAANIKNPFSMPFTGPDEGEVISVYVVSTSRAIPAKYVNTRVSPVLLTMLGLALVGIGAWSWRRPQI